MGWDFHSKRAEPTKPYWMRFIQPPSIVLLFFFCFQLGEKENRTRKAKSVKKRDAERESILKRNKEVFRVWFGGRAERVEEKERFVFFLFFFLSSAILFSSFHKQEIQKAFGREDPFVSHHHNWVGEGGANQQHNKNEQETRRNFLKKNWRKEIS